MIRDVPNAEGDATLTTSPCGSRRPNALISLTGSLVLLLTLADSVVVGVLPKRPNTNQALTPMTANAIAIAGIKNLLELLGSRAFFMVLALILEELLVLSDILPTSSTCSSTRIFSLLYCEVRVYFPTKSGKTNLCNSLF
jgi:hypothetical protein